MTIEPNDDWKSEDWKALDDSDFVHTYADVYIICGKNDERYGILYLGGFRISDMKPTRNFFLRKIFDQKKEIEYPNCEVAVERFVYHKGRINQTDNE